MHISEPFSSFFRDDIGSMGKKENTSASVAMVASIPELIVSEEVCHSVQYCIHMAIHSEHEVVCNQSKGAFKKFNDLRKENSLY